MSLSEPQTYELRAAKIANQKLEYYSQLANQEAAQAVDQNLFIHLSLAQILQNLSKTLVEIITDLANGQASSYTGLMQTLFSGDRMLYLGLLVILIAFSIYVIDLSS
jgi:hypothetical protein